MEKNVKDLMPIVQLILNNREWLIPLLVSIVVSFLTALINQGQLKKKIIHENELAQVQQLAEFRKLQEDHENQQTRKNHEFIAKLTFDNLTEFLEIAPKAVRETQFYLADEVVRFMNEHKNESDEILLNNVVKSELFTTIKKEGNNFAINVARAQNLLIYASDENRKSFSNALETLNTKSFYISSYFISGEFQKLRECIKSYPSPTSLLVLEAKVIEEIENIRNELNLMIKDYRK